MRVGEKLPLCMEEDGSGSDYIVSKVLRKTHKT